MQMGYFTGLEVSHEPGQWLVWAGVLLMGAGLFVAFYMVHMRLWIAAVPDAKGKLVLWIGGQANKNRDRFEQKFNDVVDDIRTELESASAVPRSARTRTTRTDAGRGQVRTASSDEDGGKKMATRARVVQMEPPAATGGNALLVLVGLSVVFLLIVALLGAAKSGGSLFSESNLLYVALIFYAGAGALYMGFGVTGTPRYVKFASTATAIGLAANTLAVAHRWYLSGRPPFASIYEMLLSFVWAVAAADADRRKEVRRQDHRQHHHAAGGGLRHPDATAALGSPAAGSGAAIHLAACACHAGHVELMPPAP